MNFGMLTPTMVTIDRHAKIINQLARIALGVPPVANARLAAALVLRNEIVSIGTNRKKSHPFQARFGKNADAIYLHAETHAISNGLKCGLSAAEILKCVLYICRVKYISDKRDGFTFGLSRPCQGCRRAIAEFGIDRVYYSIEGNGYAKL